MLCLHALVAMSALCSRNNRCPRMDPWGTPYGRMLRMARYFWLLFSISYFKKFVYCLGHWTVYFHWHQHVIWLRDSFRYQTLLYRTVCCWVWCEEMLNFWDLATFHVLFCQSLSCCCIVAMIIKWHLSNVCQCLVAIDKAVLNVNITSYLLEQWSQTSRKWTEDYQKMPTWVCLHLLVDRTEDVNRLHRMLCIRCGLLLQM